MQGVADRKSQRNIQLSTFLLLCVLPIRMGVLPNMQVRQNALFAPVLNLAFFSL